MARLEKHVELQYEKLVQYEVQLASQVKENFVKATELCRNPVKRGALVSAQLICHKQQSNKTDFA